MKIKALIACVGLGYALEVDEVTEVKQSVGEKLVKFGYAVEHEEQDGAPDSQLPVNTEYKVTVDDLTHKSGWYELPNGEKVQGRDKAEEALGELYKEIANEINER